MKESKDYITIEYNKVFINSGSSKIDATIAFRVGLAIGSKDYNDINYSKI